MTVPFLKILIQWFKCLNWSHKASIHSFFHLTRVHQGQVKCQVRQASECMGWMGFYSGELNRRSVLTESKDFPPCPTPLMGRRKFLPLYQKAMLGLPKLLYSQWGKREKGTSKQMIDFTSAPSVPIFTSFCSDSD